MLTCGSDPCVGTSKRINFLFLKLFKKIKKEMTGCTRDQFVPQMLALVFENLFSCMINLTVAVAAKQMI